MEAYERGRGSGRAAQGGHSSTAIPRMSQGHKDSVKESHAVTSRHITQILIYLVLSELACKLKVAIHQDTHEASTHNMRPQYAPEIN
eukprot:1361908-Amorphochlora_amoeboformis.AAC.1